MTEYQNFSISIEHHLAKVAFNRPEKANALDMLAWEEMRTIFELLDANPDIRCIILSGEGKHFCAGIDLALLLEFQSNVEHHCEGRKRESLRNLIVKLQESINAIERCRKPVLAAIHGGCLGGGVDIISACDMRYCSDDAYFAIKEVDMGLVADIGTLQRLPKLISAGLVAELAFTGRKLNAKEAASSGLVNKVLADKDKMLQVVTKIATTIATKSPLVIRGTKHILKYSRDHSVNDSLEYMATWNAGMLLSDDLTEAFKAATEKRKPEFDD